MTAVQHEETKAEHMLAVASGATSCSTVVAAGNS